MRLQSPQNISSSSGICKYINSVFSKGKMVCFRWILDVNSKQVDRTAGGQYQAFHMGLPPYSCRKWITGIGGKGNQICQAEYLCMKKAWMFSKLQVKDSKLCICSHNHARVTTNCPSQEPCTYFNLLFQILCYKPKCSNGEKRFFLHPYYICAWERSWFLITNICELPADDTICDFGRNRDQMKRWWTLFPSQLNNKEESKGVPVSYSSKGQIVLRIKKDVIFGGILPMGI